MNSSQSSLLVTDYNKNYRLEGLVLLHEFENYYPKLSSEVFIAPGAQVIGDVHLGTGVSVWFNTIIRGDMDVVEVGEKTNIQDGSVCHVDYDQPLKVGRYVTVGHRAILHGCEIGDSTLVGMGATLLNGAKVGEKCIIAAGSVVPEGKEIPKGSLVMGVPGKVVRELTQDEMDTLSNGAKDYYSKALRYLKADNDKNN